MAIQGLAWSTGEEGQRWNDGVGRDDGVVRDFGAVLDDRELALLLNGSHQAEVVSITASVRTIRQFFPISTWLPMVAASTTEPAPM
jgi:hypothetical protein